MYLMEQDRKSRSTASVEFLSYSLTKANNWLFIALRRSFWFLRKSFWWYYNSVSRLWWTMFGPFDSSCISLQLVEIFRSSSYVRINRDEKGPPIWSCKLQKHSSQDVRSSHASFVEDFRGSWPNGDHHSCMKILRSFLVYRKRRLQWHFWKVIAGFDKWTMESMEFLLFLHHIAPLADWTICCSKQQLGGIKKEKFQV